MICTEVHYNYRPVVSDGREVFPDGWETAKVGENNVTEILEHRSDWEGDRGYFDIIKSDGTEERVYKPHRAFFKLP